MLKRHTEWQQPLSEQEGEIHRRGVTARKMLPGASDKLFQALNSSGLPSPIILWDENKSHLHIPHVFITIWSLYFFRSEKTCIWGPHDLILDYTDDAKFWKVVAIFYEKPRISDLGGGSMTIILLAFGQLGS